MPRDQNRIFVIIPLCAVVILLGACSTANEISSGVSKGFGSLGRDISGMFKAAPEEDEPKASRAYDDRYYDSGYDQLATEMSDTSVQLYDFEGNEATARPQGRENRIVQGMNTSDPSVTVFSLDDGAPVDRGLETSRQNRNDYNARRSDRDFRPMTRKEPSRGGRDEVSQFSTMPNRIYFAHDSTQLTSSGYEVVDHVANVYQGQSLSVEGHASERAEQEKTIERKITNLKVSMDRALSASRALMQKGIPAEAIETKAYGDTKPPLAPQGMSTEAAARRVEIHSR